MAAFQAPTVLPQAVAAKERGDSVLKSPETLRKATREDQS
jgi:hypothetical protein